MHRADSVEDYLREPLGRYVVLEGFLHWYASEELCGFLLWGRPDEAVVRRMVQVLDVELPPKPLHSSLVDARRLEAADPAAFSVLVRYIQHRNASYPRTVLRQALVRPEGLVGAVVGGFYNLVGGPYPHHVFTDMHEALGWLQVPPPQATPLVRRLGELLDEATGQSPLLRQLHQVLRERLLGVSLTEVARQLGMSERTLQRRLKDEGTSFQHELNQVQVHTAQHLLLETDMKLTAVAVEVGCASLQHFSSLFRKLVGDSPSSWREQRRREPPSSS